MNKIQLTSLRDSVGYSTFQGQIGALKIGIIIFFGLISGFSKAQYFTTGEDPAFLRWRQINTDHFRLIYPLSFEDKAYQMAHYFEKVYLSGSYSMNHQPGKISVIFHTQTVRSNGMVALAPRRMELFTPPHQDIYAQDWLEQLAIHEFRHVVQVDKVEKQVPFVVKAMLGEQGTALVTAIHLPFWFLEGDAVVMETALSRSGRGRTPSFLMEEKAQVVDKGIFSLEKAYLGSYKDFVPDHYKLGYFLVGETRMRYGSDIWSKTVSHIARKPFSINAMDKNLLRLTGMNQRNLYGAVFNRLKEDWLLEDQTFRSEDFKSVSEPPGVYTNYRFNHVLGNGDIVTLKSGFEQIPVFIQMTPAGKEKSVIYPGQYFEESVSYRNNLIAWSEYVPDPRWDHSGKSIIRIYHIDTRQKISIKPEFKCFAPSISPDEHNVAVVEADFGNHYYLTLYNARDGSLVTRFRTSENNYFFNPVWKDNATLYVIVLTKNGKRIAMVNPFRNEMHYLLDQEMGEIKHLYPAGNKLYFISSYTGKNELYSMDTKDKSIQKEISARFGLESPAISGDGETFYLSDYTADGYRLVSIEKNQIKPVNLNRIIKAEYVLADTLARQERGIIDFAFTADSSHYISKPYRKGLFNFHSWEPFTLDINTYEFNPGVSLLSQNLLGTNVTSLGYKWQLSEKTGQAFINYEFRGWYPVISAELLTGKRADDYNLIHIYKDATGAEISRDTVNTRYVWNQTAFSFDIRVPLDLSRGKFNILLQPEIKYGFTWNRYSHSTPSAIEMGNPGKLVYRIYMHQLRRQPLRDVQPEWGWIIDGTYRYSPGGDVDLGVLKSLQMVNYWPGIWKNHGVSTYFGIQDRSMKDKYSFGDVVRMPRGWLSTDNNKLISGSFTYVVPLVHPDWNIGKLLYMKRIKASFFYDLAWMERNRYSQGKVTGTFTQNISTLGLDLMADVNFMRFYAPARIGARTIYHPETGKFGFEFLYSVDFTSF